MSWAYFKERHRWTEANNEERIIIKRQVGYARFLSVFGLFANGAIYHTFCTGIYNYRTTELFNMRVIPFPLRLALSTAITYTMCYKLWLDQIYEPELYRIALKYRPIFDKEYTETLKDADLFTSEDTQQQPSGS